MIKLSNIIKEIQQAQTGYYGTWIGHYGTEKHLVNQAVEIVQQGHIIKAIKLTGSEYVPAGNTTWEYNLETKEAKGYVCQQDGKDLQTVPADLKVINRDNIVITWHHKDGRKARVLFTRDNP